MIKVMGFLKRKPGLSREDFSKYWRKSHAQLVLKYIPQLKMKKYIQNHIMSQPDAAEPGFDGIVEAWFDNMEAFNAFKEFWTSKAGKAIRDDEERFLDRSAISMIFIEENIVL